jgi:hypothetical protein
MKSEGSNLFINWGFNGPGNDFELRLFLHGMHLLLEYPNQSRFITADLYNPQALAYFILLRNNLRSTYPLKCELAFSGQDRHIFLSSLPCNLYLDANLEDIRDVAKSHETEYYISIRIFGLEGPGDLTKAATSVQITGWTIDVELVETFLSECTNITHIHFDVTRFGIDSEANNHTATRNFRGSNPATSVKSLKFTSMSSGVIFDLLSGFHFPFLVFIHLDNCFDNHRLRKIQLPEIMANIECTSGASYHCAFVFEGRPIGPLRELQRKTITRSC